MRLRNIHLFENVPPIGSAVIIKVDGFAEEIFATRDNVGALGAMLVRAAHNIQSGAEAWHDIIAQRRGEPPEGRAGRALRHIVARVLYDSASCFYGADKSGEDISLRGPEVAAVENGLYFGANLTGGAFSAEIRHMGRSKFDEYASAYPAVQFKPIDSPIEIQMRQAYGPGGFSTLD